MKKPLMACAAFLVLLWPCKAPGDDEAGASLGGSLRNFLVYTDGGEDAAWEALSRLRVKLDVPRGRARWEFAYELIPHLREKGRSARAGALAGTGAQKYRIVDLEDELYPADAGRGDGFVIRQNLDRAFVAMAAPSVDIYIGRQPVAMGSARAVNPTDVIAPFAYETLAREERAGVDALRARVPVGSMGEMDMALVAGKDFKGEESAAFVRSRSHVLDTLVTVTVMNFRKNMLIGLDMARSMGGAGVWLEAAHTFPHDARDEDYLRVSLGADYGFTDASYAYIEYHYNGAGSSEPENYLEGLSTTAYTEGAVYLLGRHYLAPALTYRLTPLVVLSARALVNLTDGSALAMPGLEYSLSEDLYLSFGAVLALGEKPSTAPESEFGLYPDAYYAAVSLYF
jgi:hypothetical protein